MFSALLPKGAPFFELLLKQNEILCAAASSLVEMLEDYTARDKAQHAISLLEEEADLLQITITKHLSQTFITPIDREDILHINKAQEESIDLFHTLASRCLIFEFSRVRFPMRQLARTIQQMAQVTRSMLVGLTQKKDSHDTRRFRALRAECEMLLSTGLAELHDLAEPTARALLDILKWSQAYDRIERTADQINELAEIIEEAVLKNV